MRTIQAYSRALPDVRNKAQRYSMKNTIQLLGGP